MFKSLHTKLVLILVALILSVMTIVGTFLVSSVTDYHITNFQDEMTKVFTKDFIIAMNESLKEAGTDGLKEFVMAYSASIGINSNRNFYILDGKSAKYIDGSDDTLGENIELTPNILTAMNGQVGQDINIVGAYFDIAIPLNQNQDIYILEIVDNKNDLNTFTVSLINSLIRALAFSIMILVLLSYVLSKTITTPVEKLTKNAINIASGNFSEEIQVEGKDEIGVLTKTFNEMAITLKTTIEAVEGERSKLDTMFTHMKDGIVAFDKDGNLIHINPMALKMLSQQNEKKHYRDVFPNLHIDKEDISRTGNYVEIDYAIFGSTLKLFIAPFDSGDGGGLIVVLHDVTEQKKLEDSRREFVANVSHELRTPLTNIKGYTETLIANDDIDKETQKSFLEVVFNESDRMTRIVKDLLTLSRLDYGKMDIKTQVFDIEPILKNALSAMSIEAKNQNIDLSLKMDKNAKAKGDPERIAQVIINIISNAIKYNKKDGFVKISSFINNNMIEICVEDSGLGIPKEDLPRIFERFYRVDKARSRERGGTGLGLAIAKEITQEHGGTLSIDSVYGEGTKVIMALPIWREDGEI